LYLLNLFIILSWLLCLLTSDTASRTLFIGAGKAETAAGRGPLLTDHI
jgi:hypothetical protein